MSPHQEHVANSACYQVRSLRGVSSSLVRRKFNSHMELSGSIKHVKMRIYLPIRNWVINQGTTMKSYSTTLTSIRSFRLSEALHEWSCGVSFFGLTLNCFGNIYRGTMTHDTVTVTVLMISAVVLKRWPNIFRRCSKYKLQGFLAHFSGQYSVRGWRELNFTALRQDSGLNNYALSKVTSDALSCLRISLRKPSETK